MAARVALLLVAVDAWSMFGSSCDERKRVLLFGDSLTEGLLGNACHYRRASRAAAAATSGARPDCFHPYALRVAARFEAAGVSAPLAFLTTAPAEAPDGARRGAGCGAEGASHEVRVDESGVSGERADHMIPRLKALLKARGCYDAFAILAGTNNLASDAPEKILADVRELNAVARRACPRARVVHVTLPELYGEAWPTPRATRAAVNAGLPKSATVDLDAATCMTCAGAAPNRTRLWDPDAIHFTKAGYDALGDLVFDALSTALTHRARRRRDRARRRKLASLYA